MPNFRPEHYMLLPTLACQAGCRYCFARKTGGAMDRPTAEKALDFIARTAPVGGEFTLTFHGGEPLLAGEAFYAWILPLIRSRFGRRAHLSVQSNLWTVTDSLAELFRKYRVSAATSLDGPKDMCDRQRGEGYHARTTAGMELLRRHRTGAGVICTFTAESAHRAREVFLESRGPYAVHGAVPAAGTAANGLNVSADQLKRILLDSYEAYLEHPEHSRVTTLDEMARGCLEGRGCLCTFFDCLGAFAAIAPDGGVYTCQRFCGMEEYCLGNVRNNLTAEQALLSPAWKRLRASEDGMRAACGTCAHWEYCRGGCLYNALTAGAEKDPYCPAYAAVFDRIGYDLAMEMGNALLGKQVDTPVLAMAGDRPHPYDRRVGRERIAFAAEQGRRPEPFAARELRDPYPEENLNKLYLHLTFSCPLRCPHCYARGGERKSAELPPERHAEILREAADAGFEAAVLTGGEPLAYSGFDALCGALRRMDRKGMRLVLRSSFGFEIGESRLCMVCETFDEIVVSVDGDRETHDARRGEGAYSRTVANLRRAAAYAAEKLSLAATLDRSGCEGPAGQSVSALARELGIPRVRFRPVLPLGRAAETAAGEGARPLCGEETEGPESFRLRHTCGLGQNLYVEPDGSAFPCYAWCAPEKTLGSLAGESLRALLDRGDLFEYCRHDVDTNEKCRGCEVRYLCGGICKAWFRDRQNPDSGDFDCNGRRQYYLRLAASVNLTAGK